MAASVGSEAPTSYDERLVVSPSWWILGLGLALLLATSVHAGRDGLWAWLPYVLAPSGALVLLLWWSRCRVRLCEEELVVPGGRMPVALIDTVVALDHATTRRLLGKDAHPRAFTAVRPWVRTSVQLVPRESPDPTPYWLVSSRRPGALAAAIDQARAQVSGPERSSRDGSQRDRSPRD